MPNLSKSKILFAGGIGGAFTMLFHTACRLIQNDEWSPHFGYCIGIAIFFMLGAFVAWIFDEKNLRKAFFLGLGLPAFLSFAQMPQDGRLFGQGEKDNPQQGISLYKIVPSAMAQEPGVGEPITSEDNLQDTCNKQSRELQIRPNSESMKECPNCLLWFYDKNQKLLEKVPYEKGDQAYQFEIPEEATHFGIWNGAINPKIWKIPDEQPCPQYNFDYTYNFWKDFRAGLGDVNLRPYDPRLDPV